MPIACPRAPGIRRFCELPSPSLLLLVVAILGGLLLLPRLIAWDDYRAELTEQAEALTGQSVEIQGRIDLELLPRPSLTLAQATLSGGAGPPAERTLEVDRLDLRLKPLPLLAGRFEVDQIRLVRPVLQVARPKDASSVALGLAGGGIVLPLAADGPRRLSVVDGRAVLAGAGAAPEHVDRGDQPRAGGGRPRRPVYARRRVHARGATVRVQRPARPGRARRPGARCSSRSARSPATTRPD